MRLSSMAHRAPITAPAMPTKAPTPITHTAAQQDPASIAEQLQRVYEDRHSAAKDMHREAA